jgi:amidase
MRDRSRVRSDPRPITATASSVGTFLNLRFHPLSSLPSRSAMIDIACSARVITIANALLAVAYAMESPLQDYSAQSEFGLGPLWLYDDLGPFPIHACHGHPIEEASIHDLQSLLSQRKLTTRQLVGCYTRRISQVNPFVKCVHSPLCCMRRKLTSCRAVVELNPDAESIADVLDDERARGQVRGLLHGIPFLVKDNIATADRMHTTAGSLALVGSIVPRDAHVVRLLRDAGALLLGHAAMSEWADMRSTNYSEGYSARGGQTRSPYNGTLMPGGSSTGSAVAVTANMCAFALGTETDGSVINPAQRSSVVGLKPTLSLVSRAGVIPESEHFDTVGVLGRTVADTAAVLSAIAGVDERDSYTFAQAEYSEGKFKGGIT